MTLVYRDWDSEPSVYGDPSSRAFFAVQGSSTPVNRDFIIIFPLLPSKSPSSRPTFALSPMSSPSLSPLYPLVFMSPPTSTSPRYSPFFIPPPTSRHTSSHSPPQSHFPPHIPSPPYPSSYPNSTPHIRPPYPLPFFFFLSPLTPHHTPFLPTFFHRPKRPPTHPHPFIMTLLPPAYLPSSLRRFRAS